MRRSDYIDWFLSTSPQGEGITDDVESFMRNDGTNAYKCYTSGTDYLIFTHNDFVKLNELRREIFKLKYFGEE